MVARFIVVSKNCSTAPLFDVISKMIFDHVKSFHRKSFFYTCFKIFWVVQNSFPIVTNLNKINTNKNHKSIPAFDFTTLYTTIPPNFQIELLSEVINLVFKSKTQSHFGFSKTSTFWMSKGCGRRYFIRQTLIDGISFLITKRCFSIGNLMF